MNWSVCRTAFCALGRYPSAAVKLKCFIFWHSQSSSGIARDLDGFSQVLPWFQGGAVVTHSPPTLRLVIQTRTLCGKDWGSFFVQQFTVHFTVQNFDLYCIYWFPLPINLPVVISPIQCVESDVKTQINKRINIRSIRVSDAKR